MSRRRPCAACGESETTKHHVYPKSLREVWFGRVAQKIIFLCRVCHDVVHTPYRLRDVRWLQRQQPANPHWPEYLQRFSDPEVQGVIGPYRRIIKALTRKSKAIHHCVTGEPIESDIDTSISISILTDSNVDVQAMPTRIYSDDV